MSIKYYNEKIGATIVFTGDDFFVSGNEDLVREQDILDLHDDKNLRDWRLVV